MSNVKSSEKTTDEIIPEVIECVAESLALSPGNINPDSRLITDLNADSLDIMDIIFLLDKKFNINLQKDDFDLIARVKMTKEEAIQAGQLTPLALERIRKILPSLPSGPTVMVKDLGSYISIRTLAQVVEETLSAGAKLNSELHSVASEQVL